MTSNLSSITVSVPSGDGYEQPAEAGVRGSIAAKWRRMPQVDQNGKTVATRAETGVTDNVPTPGQPPRMVDALMAAAASAGADAGALTDSQSFMLAIGSISPADTDGITGAIRDAMAANPSIAIAPAAPGMMRPNPAQGSSGSGWKPTPTTAADRIRAEAAKAMGQPRPPGSTTY